MTCNETALWLLERDGFLILTHKNPDGDTIGCAAALCQTLRDAGKTAHVLPNADTTERFFEFIGDYWAPADFAPETVVSVDVASAGMLTANAAPYRDRVDLSIDHHASHEQFARELCLDGGSAACGEILYEIILKMGIPLSKRTASCLYMAITTDTGCFRYSNTTPHTLHTCADLIATGIPFTYINKKFFRTKSVPRVRIESRLMSEMELYDEGVTAIVTITDEMMASCGATENDIEDIAALAGEVEGVRASVTIKQKGESTWKISLRTWADLDASAVCARLGGGGHKAAAGCTVEGTLSEVKKKILDAIHAVRQEQKGVLEDVKI